MTAPDTDTLAGLLAEATPGPWVTCETYVSDKHFWFDADGARHGETPNFAFDCAPEANARLIALTPTIAAEVIALRAEVATLRASEARMREALAIAETTIADLKRANASYQAALLKCGIDGSKGTEE